MRFCVRSCLIICGSVLLLYTFFLARSINFSVATILPALLGLPLLGAALFYRQLTSAEKIWQIIRLMLFIGYALCALAVLTSSFLILNSLKTEPDGQADYVIVLGAGLYGSRVSLTLAGRLDTALSFWLEHPESLIVVAGGQGPDELIPEAVAMADYLTAKGVPPAKIILEDRSTSTEENLSFSRDLLQPTGDTSVVVVTSSYHVFRAKRKAAAYFEHVSTLGSPSLWYLLPADLLRETLAIGRLLLLGY